VYKINICINPCNIFLLLIYFTHQLNNTTNGVHKMTRIDILKTLEKEIGKILLQNFNDLSNFSESDAKEFEEIEIAIKAIKETMNIK